jgi:hypothetical protein
MSEDAASRALRRELEAVFAAHFRALEARDAPGFRDTVDVPEEKAGMIRGRFGELAGNILKTAPRPETGTFLAVRTDGADLAGYYGLHRDPPSALVSRTLFVKVAGRWKIVPEIGVVSFEPAAGEDVVARARELIETEEGLRLERPAEIPPSAPPSAWDEAVQGTLDCMAYGYEVQIAINGAMLPFRGGKSWSGRLFGFREGAGPQAPAILLAGDNQFDLAYRRTGDLDASLDLTVRGPSGDPVLQFGPIRGESGRLSAVFRL